MGKPREGSLTYKLSGTSTARRSNAVGSPKGQQQEANGQEHSVDGHQHPVNGQHNAVARTSVKARASATYHPGAGNTSENRSSNSLKCRFGGRRTRMIQAFLALLCTAGLLGQLAVMYFKYNADFFGFHQRDPLDGGPGPLWKPPDERPLPLSAFPDFSGFGLKGGRNPKRNAEKKGEEGAEVGGRSGADETPTLLFMHLWKCAGSSLRHLLRDWAELETQSIGIVVRCGDKVSEEGKGKICLKKHELIDKRIQGPYIQQNQVLAGHFTWGFQTQVKQPYVMFTTLRNPLELFVSGQQYLNRKSSKVLSKAITLVEETMVKTVQNHKLLMEASGVAKGEDLVLPDSQKGKTVGFLHRLVEREQVAGKTMKEVSRAAISNLDEMWLVGVIEQYEGFMTVLRVMMDPQKRHSELWKEYAKGQYNASPNGAGKVLAGIYPELVEAFNETLAEQWKVYDHAVNLFKHRCGQMLHTKEAHLCEVPGTPSSYHLTNLEMEELWQQRHPATSYSPAKIIRAQKLWAEYGPSHRDIRADEVWAYFESHGLNLTNSEKRENLWSRLQVTELFHSPGPYPKNSTDPSRRNR